MAKKGNSKQKEVIKSQPIKKVSGKKSSKPQVKKEDSVQIEKFKTESPITPQQEHDAKREEWLRQGN